MVHEAFNFMFPPISPDRRSSTAFASGDLGGSPPEWLLKAMELILVAVDYGVTELSMALVGGWLIRSRASIAASAVSICSFASAKPS